jgi:quercetin dioxygenase-like cupin family protein
MTGMDRVPADSARIVLVPPGGGVPVVRLHGETTVLVAGAEDTNGAYALRRNSAPPGFDAVPLHVHRSAEEAFLVTDGELAVYAEGRWQTAPSGSFVLIPRWTEHALGNASPATVSWITLISPGADAGWVQAEHELIVASAGEPDRDRLADIHRRFGLEIIGPAPPLPEGPPASR